MAGLALTTSAVMMCPHGGTVTGTTSRRVTAGAPMLTSTDTFTIAGCPFVTGSNPSPCVTVRWAVPDARVTLTGGFTLSTGSTGLCLAATQVPQGAVIITSTQPRVSTR